MYNMMLDWRVLVAGVIALVLIAFGLGLWVG